MELNQCGSAPLLPTSTPSKFTLAKAKGNQETPTKVSKKTRANRDRYSLLHRSNVKPLTADPTKVFHLATQLEKENRTLRQEIIQLEQKLGIQSESIHKLKSQLKEREVSTLSVDKIAINRRKEQKETSRIARNVERLGWAVETLAKLPVEKGETGTSGTSKTATRKANLRDEDTVYKFKEAIRSLSEENLEEKKKVKLLERKLDITLKRLAWYKENEEEETNEKKNEDGTDQVPKRLGSSASSSSGSRSSRKSKRKTFIRKETIVKSIDENEIQERDEVNFVGFEAEIPLFKQFYNEINHLGIEINGSNRIGELAKHINQTADVVTSFASKALNPKPTMAKLMESIRFIFKTNFLIPNSLLWLIDNNLKVAWTFNDQNRPVCIPLFSPENEGILKQVIASGDCVVIEKDVKNHEMYNEKFDSHMKCSEEDTLATIPLKDEHEGVVAILQASRAGKEFTDNDLLTLRLIGSYIVSYVQPIRYFHQMESKNTHIVRLLNFPLRVMDTEVNDQTPPRMVLLTLQNISVETLSADNCRLFFLGSSKKKMIRKASSKSPEMKQMCWLDGDLRWSPTNSGIAGSVIEGGKIEYINDPYGSDHRFNGNIDMDTYGLLLVCIPIRAFSGENCGEVIGCIEISFRYAKKPQNSIAKRDAESLFSPGRIPEETNLFSLASQIASVIALLNINFYY